VKINEANAQNLVAKKEIGINYMDTSDGHLMVSPPRCPDVSPGAAAVDTGDVHHSIERRRIPFPERIFPGAYREGGSDNEEGYDADELTIQSPIEPPIPPTVSAELVNTEEEERRRQDNINRAVQEALQRGRQLVQDQINQALERELQQAVVAEVVPEVTPKRDRRWKFAGAFLLLVVLIVVGVVLGITLRPDDAEQPTLLDLLSSVSSDGGEALQTPSTSQNRAFNWLAANTDLGIYTNERIIQRYALATLYFSTNGDRWMNNARWLDNGHECSWWPSNASIEICADTGVVVDLYLALNSLSGTIPPEIGLLSSVADLYLDVNNLKGTIPSEIGLLSDLGSWQFVGNSLEGRIPSEIGQLKHLSSVHGDSNQLSETIPSEIGLLSDSLVEFWFHYNELGGPIPTEIGQLTQLDSLSLFNNSLTGTIPSEAISSLTNLDWLGLSHNMFTGDFTCPAFIDYCGISCDYWDANYTDACRSLG
jgi:hypothetical protein